MSRCCNFAFWKSPVLDQTFVILRHSIRLDYVDPDYASSAEGCAWPVDAPLSPDGVALAQEVAEELSSIHKDVGFGMIVTSPYLRCMETARECAKRLDLDVLVDQELGEFRNKDMPKEVAHRSPAELAALADEWGIKLRNRKYNNGGFRMSGSCPKWGETLEAAHARWIRRIEKYILASRPNHCQIIFVTHADALHATINMLGRGSKVVREIDFCAMLVATRSDKREDDDDHGAYGANWEIKARRVDIEETPKDVLDVLRERQHLETCDEHKVQLPRLDSVRDNVG